MSSPTPQVSTGEAARAAAPKPCMLRHAPFLLRFDPTAASPAPTRRPQDAHCLRQHPSHPHSERGGAASPHQRAVHPVPGRRQAAPRDPGHGHRRRVRGSRLNTRGSDNSGTPYWVQKYKQGGAAKIIQGSDKIAERVTAAVAAVPGPTRKVVTRATTRGARANATTTAPRRSASRSRPLLTCAR